MTKHPALEWAYKNDTVSGGKYGVFSKKTLDKYVKEGLLEQKGNSDTPEMKKLLPNTYRYEITLKGIKVYEKENKLVKV